MEVNGIPYPLYILRTKKKEFFIFDMDFLCPLLFFIVFYNLGYFLVDFIQQSSISSDTSYLFDRLRMA